MYIRNELLADAESRGIKISSSVVYTALHWVVNTYMYQKKLSVGGFRYDINGNKTTEISVEHQKFAAEKVALIKQNLKNKKKSSRPFKVRTSKPNARTSNARPPASPRKA